MFASELMLCLSGLMSPQAPPQAPAVVMQEIPLRGIVLPELEGVPLASRFIESLEGGGKGWSALPGVARGDVVDALRMRFGNEISNNELSIDVASDMRDVITLHGTKELTQAAATYAAWIERSVSRGIQVDLRVYAVDTMPAEPHGTYSQGGLSGMAGTRLLWSGSSTGVAQRFVTFDAIRRQPVMIDFDVEVAQKADIADPKVSAVLSGLRAVVQPFGFASSDEIGVLADIGFGIRKDTGDTWSSGVMKQPLLDSPRVDRVSARMSGRVPSGGSLVAWAGGDPALGPQIAVEIALRWRGPAPQIAPTDAVLPIAFGLPQFEPEDDHGSDGIYVPGDEKRILAGKADDPTRSKYQADELTGIVQDAIQSEGSFVIRAGSVLIVHGTAEQVTRARELIATMIDSAALGVDVVAETRSDDGKLLLHRTLVPTLLGVPCSLDRGEEGVFVRDLDVEIAQSATAMNPVVDHWFSGIRCEAVVSRGIGSLVADVGIDLSARGPAQRRAVEGDRGGAFDVAASDGRRMTLRSLLERGETVGLGQGPSLMVGGGSVRTQQSVTLR